MLLEIVVAPPPVVVVVVVVVVVEIVFDDVDDDDGDDDDDVDSVFVVDSVFDVVDVVEDAVEDVDIVVEVEVVIVVVVVVALGSYAGDVKAFNSSRAARINLCFSICLAAASLIFAIPLNISSRVSISSSLHGPTAALSIPCPT